MNLKNVTRKVFGGVFAGGATVSMGFLSFAGMFIIAPGLGLCLTALVLAIAYEGQIFNEAVSKALRRMFDENYLKKGLAKREILEQLRLLKELKFKANKDGSKEEQALKPEDIDNLFLANYYEQHSYVQRLEKNHHLSNNLADKKEAAEQQLEDFEIFYIKQLKNKKNEYFLNPQESAVKKLITKQQKKALRQEIFRKQWLIRLSWIFAIGGGVSSGFAAYSAVAAGVASLAAACTAFSLIPAGVLIALAVFTAFGYTFMLYQTMSDFVQEYNGKLIQYCEKRHDEATGYHESTLSHVARMTGMAIVVGLGIFATIATAGTWWQATNKGALLLKFGDACATVIRNVTVPLMAVSTLIFNLKNSLDSVDRISRSDFKAAVLKIVNSVKEIWDDENILQFLNPFRVIEKLIFYTSRSILFLGHIISMGLIADRFDPVPPVLNTALNAANEATVDFNYLPHEETEHHHSHDSKILDVLFFPVTVVITVFKLLAVAWDMPFSGFEEAWVKSFPLDDNDDNDDHHNHEHEHGHDHGHDHHGHHHEPAPPRLLDRWLSSTHVIANGIGPTVLTARVELTTSTTRPTRSVSAPELVRSRPASNDQDMNGLAGTPTHSPSLLTPLSL